MAFEFDCSPKTSLYLQARQGWGYLSELLARLNSRVETCLWQHKHIYSLLSSCDPQRVVGYFFLLSAFVQRAEKLMKCMELRVSLEKSLHYETGQCGATPVLSTSHGLLWWAVSFLIPMFTEPSGRVLLIRVFFVCLFVFLAALGLPCCARAFSSCGEQGLLFVAVHGLLIAVASLAAEHGI